MLARVKSCPTLAAAAQPDIAVRWPGHELWSLDPGILHCNHGSFGAVPRPVRAIQHALHAELDADPSKFFRRTLDDRLNAARAVVAAYLGADLDGFAFVRNATEGASVVLASFPLGPGDEVILTDHAYGAVRNAVEASCAARHATLIPVALPLDDNAAIAAVVATLGPRSKLLVIDQVASLFGRVLPIAAICAAARQAGVAVLIDGAHVPGMLPVVVDELGCDFWVGNFHKWLCSPPGSGALWVAPQWREVVRPLVVSHRWMEPYPGSMLRFGTDDVSAHLCVPSAIECLKHLDPNGELVQRNHRLTVHARTVLASVLALDPVECGYAWMAAVWLPDGFVCDESDAYELHRRIGSDAHAEVSINVIAGRGALRVSAFLYNCADDYEILATRLGPIISRSPTSPST